MESFDAALASVGRSVVEDPEHTGRSSVGLVAHDLLDESFEGSDAELWLAAAIELGSPDIPGGEVGESPLSAVLVLDESGATWGRRQNRVAALEGLDAGLLVGRDDAVRRL